MGLDMYLAKKTYVKNWDYMREEEKHTITVRKAGGVVSDIDPSRISYIEEQVMYWRKSNGIHHWFVENVQKGVDDCGTYYVEGSQLEDLVSLCEDAIGNPDEAHEFLPSVPGCFFGSTEYDEWYFQDLQDTVDALRKVLAEEGLGDFYYHSSW